jgi:hypothetical protein
LTAPRRLATTLDTSTKVHYPEIIQPDELCYRREETSSAQPLRISRAHPLRRPAQRTACLESRLDVVLKKVLELLLCILHPLAVVLIWLNLIFTRRRMGLLARLAWAVAVIVPFVPFLYVLTGNDFI